MCVLRKEDTLYRVTRQAEVIDGVLVALAAAAGWLDGTAYLRAHVFIANMTGNTVLLGLGLAHYPPGEILRPAVAIAAFVFGTLVGSAVAARFTEAAHAANHLLVIESAVLALFAALWYVYSGNQTIVVALIALAAVGMGLQQVATERIHPKPAVSTTYQSGTVERLGIGIYDALHGAYQTLRLNGSIWLVYLASAVGVALLGKESPPLLGGVPFVVVGVTAVALLALLRRQRVKG